MIKVPSPVYTLKIPSTGKEVKYSPFVVKDQKALLLAAETEDSIVMIDTLKKIIEGCCEKINVDDLTIFDMEYIFTKIRCVSVGEISEVIFTCEHCEAQVPAAVDLTKIKVVFNEDNKSDIKLIDGFGVKMVYPTPDFMKVIEDTDMHDVEQMIQVMISCIECVYSEDEVLIAKDASRQELIDIFEALTFEQYLKIADFFTTMPRAVVPVSFTCPECGKLNDRDIEGLGSFFS